MADLIKKINISGTPYDVCDQYARDRLEGLATIYSISCLYTYTSGDTFVDWDTEADVAYSAMTILNSKFNSSAADVTISATDVTSGTSGYVVLKQTKSANKYYAKKLSGLNLGDTIYVVEPAPVADRWLSAWTESPLSGTFTALEGKIDLSNYPTKSIAGLAGTYNTSAASTETTGSSGAQTATGTASVTYKKSDAATGTAGAATVTSSSAGATGTSANTGNAGGVTVSGSNFSFEGTAATITSSGSYTPEGTISAISAASHSHSITATSKTASFGVVTDNKTSEDGAHTHNVTINTKATVADAAVSAATTGTVTYTPAGTVSAVTAAAHSHTVNVSKATVSNNVTGTKTGSAGYHDHTVDTHDHDEDVTVVTGYPNFSGGSLTGTKTFNTDAIKEVTLNASTTSTAGPQYLQDASVSGTFNTNAMRATWGSDTLYLSAASTGSPSLSKTTKYMGHTVTAAGSGTVGFTAAALGAASTTTAAGGSSALTFTTSGAGPHTHSLTNSALTYVSGATTSTAGAINVTPTFSGTGVRLVAAGQSIAVSASTSAVSAGAHTHAIEATTASFTYIESVGANTSLDGAINVTPTFTGTTATISVSANYTPAGTIGGSQTIAAHSHSYIKPADHTHSVTISGHTHSIGLTDTTAAGSASVAVSNHTHSMGHTHTVTVPNCVGH